jgi:hypothetical protein
MFNLENYETVEERLAKFWEKYPDGRIETALIDHSPTRFIVGAYIYRTEADARYWTSGLAEETVASRGVNATSALENCETSAIGRALANAGFATKGKRASREEMEKVARVENDKVTVKIEADLGNDWESFVKEKPAATTTLAQGVELVTKELNAKEVPTCPHGTMNFKEGTSAKTGRPYRGYTCPNKDRNDQCQPIWLA